MITHAHGRLYAGTTPIHDAPALLTLLRAEYVASLGIDDRANLDVILATGELVGAMADKRLWEAGR